MDVTFETPKGVWVKLLKAFVRTGQADDVVKALEAAAAPGVTISTVHGVGYGYGSYMSTLAPSTQRTPEVCKIEVVCHDGDVDGLLKVVLEKARTGYRGDGIVFITPVETALKIRTGQEVL